MMPGKLIRLILTTVLIGAVFSATAFAQVVSDAGTDAGPTTAKKPEAIASFNTRAASESHERVWQMTGPFGGDVTALAIDPRSADHILIGTSDSQIYRSTDGGQVWKRIRPGIKAPGFIVTTILFDREKPSAIYVGVKPLLDLSEETAGSGAYLSEDGGESFRALEGMKGRAVRGIVQSSKDANVLAAAARNGIYRSLDRGQTWERITPANDPELMGFHSVAIDPRDVNLIYVGTHHLPWKTTDGGRSWKRAGSKETGMIDDSDIMAIHIDESNPDIVLMSACSGIYRSTDGCAKWTKIQGIPYSSRRTHVIYQHPTKPDVVYAGTTEGLWISTQGGKPDSWRRVTSLRLVINAIAVHPAMPDRVLLGAEDNGVLVSADGGESYEASNAGYTNRHVRTVLADRTERGRVYSGVIFDGSNSGFFVSEDGGLTWEQSMQGMGVRDVYSLFQSETNPDTLYAGTNAGLFRSDDKGRSWSQVKKPEEVPAEEQIAPATAPVPLDPMSPPQKPAVSVRPRRVKRIVQARGMQPRRKPKGQVKTRPKKAAKKKPKSPPKPPPNPNDPVELRKHVFAVVPLTLRKDSSSETPGEGDATPSNWLIASTWDGLFYSEDEKKGWRPLRIRPWSEADIAPPVQPRVNAIGASPHAPGVIYAGTEEGLYVSQDNGASFKLKPLDEETTRIRSIVFDPRSAEKIDIGTSPGVFRSLDGGQTWERR
ncbi:MAG: WD40/YVTN/BNR-like repeat-containing protein, partial [Blastocatellia bacterium]